MTKAELDYVFAKLKECNAETHRAYEAFVDAFETGKTLASMLPPEGFSYNHCLYCGCEGEFVPAQLAEVRARNHAKVCDKNPIAALRKFVQDSIAYGIATDELRKQANEVLGLLVLEPEPESPLKPGETRVYTVSSTSVWGEVKNEDKSK